MYLDKNHHAKHKVVKDVDIVILLLWKQYYGAFISSSEILNLLLEKYQRHCLRVIYPNIEHTDERLSVSGLDDICVRLNIICLNYVSKVKGASDHPLHQHCHSGHTSSRSGRHIPAKSRTSLKQSSLFQCFR